MEVVTNQQNDLINDISARKDLVLGVVKLIIKVLSGNLTHRLAILKNNSSFTKRITKIDICIKNRILEVVKQYDDDATSSCAELKKLVQQFSTLKSEIQKKFSAFIGTIKKKKSVIDSGRLEFSKVLRSDDDFIIQRYLACNKKSMFEMELSFQNDLLDQTREMMKLDAQILQEFDKILHEIDKKKIASVSSWDPLKSYNEKNLENYFKNLPVDNHQVTERIAFLNKSCSKMQVFTIFGDKVYCFAIVSGSDMQKMAGKYNFREELQDLIGHKKQNVHYFECKTPVFTTSLSKVYLCSLAMDCFVTIKVPSSKWYKKEDKLTLYFRDSDEMNKFMDALKLEIPGSGKDGKRNREDSGVNV